MNEKLQIWKDRFAQAEAEYSARLADYDRWTKQYKGDRQVFTDGRRAKNASVVRNFTFELIEAQIDNTIPMPKVSYIRRKKSGTRGRSNRCSARR